MRVVSLGLIALVAGACALNPAPVPVVGDSRDISSLAGEWSGEYRGKDNGRTGSILFRLAAGTDTAYGDVIMVPRTSARGLPSHPESHISHEHTQIAASRALSIRFVNVTGRQITGVIDLYPSPDCECQLLTTFRGERRANRIEGSFTTVHTGCDMPLEQGTWWAERARSQ